MTPSVLRRVRWGNVARLAGAAAALALVVAWPRLRPHEPPLPPRTVLPAPRSAEADGRIGSGRAEAGSRAAGGAHARIGSGRPADGAGARATRGRRTGRFRPARRTTSRGPCQVRAWRVRLRVSPAAAEAARSQARA